MDTFRMLLNLPTGASSFADGVDLLHLFVISVTMIMSIYVFLAATLFTVRSYQGETAARAVTTGAGASAVREVAIVAGVLGVFLLWWVIGFVQFARMADPPDDALPVDVVAKQWMWKFTYPDGRVANDVLTVPQGKDVRLVMTSRDVIHSFYVPQFRVKHDVLPGRYVSAWFRATRTGEFDIYCAEYCGINHSRMLGRVVVLSPADYEKWLHREQDAPEGEELARRGVTIATRRACTSCHTLDGQPHVGPTWAKLYGRTVHLADGRTVLADEEYLTRSMMDPDVDVVAGFKPLMPSYAGLLSPGEVGALLELIRALGSAPLAPSVALPRLDVAQIDGGSTVPGPGNTGVAVPPLHPPPLPNLPQEQAGPRARPFPFPAPPVAAPPPAPSSSIPLATETQPPAAELPWPTMFPGPTPPPPFSPTPPAPATKGGVP